RVVVLSTLKGQHQPRTTGLDDFALKELHIPVRMDLGALPAAVDLLGRTQDDPVPRPHLVEGDTSEVPQLGFVEIGPELDVDAPEPPAVRKLEREIIQPCGARLVLSLKSGKHYYARYEQEGGFRQHIASGGGGAFLHPTHNLPERTNLPGAEGPVAYRKECTYPSPDVSKRLRKRIWLLAPYNLPLAGVFGAVQVLLALMLGLHLGDRHVALGLGDLLNAAWESQTFFLLILLVMVSVAGMVRFAHDARGVRRFVVGTLHSTVQLASAAGFMIAASWLSSAFGLRGVWSLVAFLGLVALVGGIGGMVGMSGYLWVANCFGLHGTEGYAAQHHQDLKHFIRLHIEADGALTVYPVGVDRVGRKWTLCADAPAHEPWFTPSGSEPEPHLIEKPITITGTGRVC
ncbi:MAG: hypothetical protein ACRDRO_01800, partial [Pseudonocardiaceae bacterium]